MLDEKDGKGNAIQSYQYDSPVQDLTPDRQHPSLAHQNAPTISYPFQRTDSGAFGGEVGVGRGTPSGSLCVT